MLFDLEGFEYPAAMADDLSREDEKQRRKKMLMSFPKRCWAYHSVVVGRMFRSYNGLGGQPSVRPQFDGGHQTMRLVRHG